MYYRWYLNIPLLSSFFFFLLLLSFLLYVPPFSSSPSFFTLISSPLLPFFLLFSSLFSFPSLLFFSIFSSSPSLLPIHRNKHLSPKSLSLNNIPTFLYIFLLSSFILAFSRLLTSHHIILYHIKIYYITKHSTTLHTTHKLINFKTISITHSYQHVVHQHIDCFNVRRFLTLNFFVKQIDKKKSVKWKPWKTLFTEKHLSKFLFSHETHNNQIWNYFLIL